jgi:hypothetical protein
MCTSRRHWAFMLIAASITLLLGCNGHYVSVHYRQWQACKAEHDKRIAESDTEAAYDTYFNSLLALDVTHCPLDYQQAWQDYLALEKEYCAYVKPHKNTISFWLKAAVGTATAGASLIPEVQTALDLGSRRDSTEGRLETLWKKYGW